MYERFVERRVEEALSDTPPVLIVGPRRAGKTTLVRKMGEAGRIYITLDDQTTLDAARSDPVGFIRGLDQAIIARSCVGLKCGTIHTLEVGLDQPNIIENIHEAPGRSARRHVHLRIQSTALAGGAQQSPL